MLKGGLRERREEEGTDKALQNFGGRAKERDRAIGSAQVKGFSWLRDGKNESVFPDGGKVRVGEREVEEEGKIGDCFWA